MNTEPNRRLSGLAEPVNDGRPTYIYALYDPTFRSSRIYIGQTVQPRQRLRDHLKPAGQDNDRKRCWITSLATRGVKPHMHIIATVPPGGDYFEAERCFIAFAKAVGVPLANLTDGGEGTRGYEWTEELRRHQTARVRRGQSRNATGYKGVNRQNRRGTTPRYTASIKDQHGDRNLGSFATTEEAALAYDHAARASFGADAALNFPFPGERSARLDVDPQQWSGLPDVTSREPGELNRKNTSGAAGVHQSPKQPGKWTAVIRRGGRGRTLCGFDSREDAERARVAAIAFLDSGGDIDDLPRRERKMAPELRERLRSLHTGRKWDDKARANVARARHAQTLRADSPTGFKGVRRKANGYDARIDQRYVGHYKTAIEAAAAYDVVAREMWGADAALNFPRPGEKSARPGIEPQEWTELQAPRIRAPGELRVANKTGFPGVSWVKASRRWYACIRVNGKSVNLGLYDRIEDAAAAYERAKAKRDGATAPQQLRLIA